MADLNRKGDIDVNICDPVTQFKAQVDASGQLKVVTPAPAPPEGTTGVSRTEYGSVSTTDDDVYIIPNGEDLVVQRLSGGAETGNGGSVIELWYDPNGDGTGMTIIDSIMADGSSDQHSLDVTYTGDGTKSIRMRRRRFGGGAIEIFGRWEGYY